MSDCIRLLQIGDIHLPEWSAKSTTQDLDHKDRTYSPYIIDDLRGLDNISTVLKGIAKLSTKDEINAIAVMGDFTSWGEVDHIHHAIEIIDTITTAFDGTKKPTCAVPGNHDVSKAHALKLGDTSKFEPIEKAISDHSWHPPPIEGVEQFKVTGDASFLNLLLINTSIGSWSPHLFPDLLEEQFDKGNLKEKALSLTLDLKGNTMPLGEILDDKPFENREQQLFAMDIPYISSGTKQDLSRIISSPESKDTQIIVGHHNLLPQRTTRVTPYGELLNSGTFRRYLQNTQRNVVYLHGHIHDDPVEIIGVPSFSKGSQAFSQLSTNKIISISAPPIWEGFNEVAFFLDDQDEPYLLRITKYRLDENMEITNFTNQDSVYVPLAHSPHDVLDGDGRKLLQALKENQNKHNVNGVMKWPDLIQYFDKKKGQLEENELEHAILKLFCAGLIVVNHLGREKHRWSIQLKGADSQ